MKSILNFTGTLCLVFSSLFSLSGMSKPTANKLPVANTVSDTRVINKSFDVNADALVKLLARESEVNISTWNQNKVEVNVTLFVEAYEKEDMEKMFEEMQVIINGSREQVTIQSKLEVSTVVFTGLRQRVRTKNHGTLKVKQYSFSYDVKMPAGNSLNLKNHFGKVQLGAHAAQLDLELYECKLEAAQVNAQGGKLNLRFSKGTLGSIKTLDLKMYESKVTLANADKLTLNTKFSKLNAGDVSAVNITAYESNIELGKLEHLSGTYSFGSLQMASANNISLTAYELKLNVGTVQKLVLQDSKFSKINIGTLGNLTGRNLYENSVVIGTLETAKVNSKFTNFQIGTLSSSFESEGYESDLNIARLESGFKLLKVSGKFCKNEINLSSGTGFQLVADVQFGDVRYPEGKLERQSYTKQSNGFKLTAKTKGYSGTTLIDFSGYENNMNLNF